MASKTVYLNLKGKIKWANGRSGGLFAQDPEYGGYRLTLYPDQESWDQIKKSGLDLKSRNDEDGDYIIFKRPHEKLFMGERKTTYFGPPKVFFVEGIKPTKEIGNLSEVEAQVSVYQAGKYKGHRLNEVIVTELVPYERSTSDRPNLTQLKLDTDEDEPENEVRESPPFDLDDEIPFGKPSEEKEEPKAKSANPFKKRG